MTDTHLLAEIEEYYDTVPRAAAIAESVGPFTAFRRKEPQGWPYYARPRLGLDRPVEVADVLAVRAHQREAGSPEALEWVAEVTPSLLSAAREAGLRVAECPLLALPADPSLLAQFSRRVGARSTGHRLERVTAESPDLAAVVGAVRAAFAGSDDADLREPVAEKRLLRQDMVRMIGAYDDHGVVGGGTHSPRGSATEITGIGVLPRARRRGLGAALTAALAEDARGNGARTIFLSAGDEAASRVYQAVGFRRVGTACIAEPSR